MRKLEPVTTDFRLSGPDRQEELKQILPQNYLRRSWTIDDRIEWTIPAMSFFRYRGGLIAGGLCEKLGILWVVINIPPGGKNGQNRT